MKTTCDKTIEMFLKKNFQFLVWQCGLIAVYLDNETICHAFFVSKIYLMEWLEHDDDDDKKTEKTRTSEEQETFPSGAIVKGENLLIHSTTKS